MTRWKWAITFLVLKGILVYIQSWVFHQNAVWTGLATRTLVWWKPDLESILVKKLFSALSLLGTI